MAHSLVFAPQSFCKSHLAAHGQKWQHNHFLVAVKLMQLLVEFFSYIVTSATSI